MLLYPQNTRVSPHILEACLVLDKILWEYYDHLEVVCSIFEFEQKKRVAPFKPFLAKSAYFWNVFFCLCSVIYDKKSSYLVKLQYLLSNYVN